MEAPQDAVFVQRGDGFEGGRHFRFDRRDLRRARLGGSLAQRRIEARPEQVDQQARHLRIGGQRAFHVFLTERNAGLPQIFRVGTHDGDLAPGEAGAQHQTVQPVILERAFAQFLDRLDEAGARGGEIDGRFVRGLHPQDLHGNAMRLLVAALLAQQEGHLADHAQTEILGERQDVGQRKGLAWVEQAEREAVRRHPGAAADLDAEFGAVDEPLELLDIGRGLDRIEGLAIDHREPVAPAPCGGASFRLAESFLQGGPQPVVPRRRRLDQVAFERGKIGTGLLARAQLERIERLDQCGIAADRGDDGRHLSLPRFLQQGGKALRKRGIEALARNEDQRGGEAAHRVEPREQRHAPALLQLQDAQHMVVERVLVDLKQLVAWVGIEDRQQGLAVVAVAVESGAAQQRFDAAAQQRHVVHRRVIGGGGEQADEAMFAGRSSVGVAGLHDHAVHRADAVNQRLTIGLHDQDVVGAARKSRHRLAAAHTDLEQADLVAAQDAQRRSGHQLVAQAAGLVRVLDVAIAAMAEEGEVVGLEPAQEVLVLREARRMAGRQVGDGVEAGAAHRLPVIDRQPHFGQHARERSGDLVQQPGIGLAIDLDVHHRLGAGAFAGFERDAHQVAVEIAARRHHRMGEQMDGEFAAIEFVGDRIDQERHVVVHDLHDRVTALEPVVGEGRVEDADLGDAGQAPAGEGQQGGGGSGTLVYGRGGEVLVGQAAKQPARKLCGILTASLERGSADGVQSIDARHRGGDHILCIPPQNRGRCYA